MTVVDWKRRYRRHDVVIKFRKELSSYRVVDKLPARKLNDIMAANNDGANAANLGNNNGNVIQINVNARKKSGFVEDSIPRGLNLGQKVGRWFRSGRGFFTQIFRDGIHFYRYALNVVMVNNMFRVADDPTVPEAMREEWREQSELVATRAKRAMNFALEKAEVLRVVSILAKARGNGIIDDSSYAKLMEFPITRRDGRKEFGGYSRSAFIRWEPTFYWRGIAISHPGIITKAIEKLKVFEADRIRRYKTRNSIVWRPLVVPGGDTSRTRLESVATNWNSPGRALPPQIVAVEADYACKANSNRHAVELGNLLDSLNTGADVGRDELVAAARATLGVVRRRENAGEVDEDEDDEDNVVDGNDESEGDDNDIVGDLDPEGPDEPSGEFAMGI